LGPESCSAAVAAPAGTAHTVGLDGTVAAEVADIPSSQGQNSHHLPDVSAGLLLLLHRISGALLLTPRSTIIPATTSRACSLPGQRILAGTLVANISVTLTGIPLHHRLLSGDCRIVHLDLLVLAARGYTSGTLGAWMRG
jgi:hypothetical protein